LLFEDLPQVICSLIFDLISASTLSKPEKTAFPFTEYLLFTELYNFNRKKGIQKRCRCKKSRPFSHFFDLFLPRRGKTPLYSFYFT